MAGAAYGAHRFLKSPEGVLRFKYMPEKLTQQQYQQLAAKSGWQTDPIEVDQEVRLRGLVKLPEAPDAPWVVMFAGNGAQLLEGGQKFLEQLAQDNDWGLATWAYRGFDGSTGRPGPKGLAQDARAISQHLEQKHQVNSPRLHVVGFSLGTFVAVQVAVHRSGQGRPPETLSLIAPFTRIHAVPVSWYWRWARPDAYRLLPVIDEVQAPLLVLHGTADEALPVAQGREVAHRAEPQAKLVELDGAGHVGALQSVRTLEEVRHFIGSR